MIKLPGISFTNASASVTLSTASVLIRRTQQNFPNVSSISNQNLALYEFMRLGLEKKLHMLLSVIAGDPVAIHYERSAGISTR